MKRTLIKGLSRVAPNAMVQLAYNQLTNPQIKKLRPHELEVLDTARQEALPFGDGSIQTYHWTGSGPAILLVHGWEGQAGNFSDLILRLRAENYAIWAFDAPAHGFSSAGQTNLFAFAQATGMLIEKLGVRQLVSHSFGGVATTWALYHQQETLIDKYVLLTTPDTFRERIEDISHRVGITQKVQQRLIHRLETETGYRVDNMQVSKFVKALNVRSALLLHDKNDKVIPIAQSRSVCNGWDACEMDEIEGTGHFRILRTDFVLDRVLQFLSA